jgi:quinolinate synthase
MGLAEKIEKLKKRKNAVILAHNYQLPEVQDIADFVGDSLGLSIEASKTGAEVIVFCGVYFMAETAKILSPDKKVFIPDRNAGCPMAEMINAKQFRNLKARYPKAITLCYVNTTAEVKAECDLCCTSANAEKIVRQIMQQGRRDIIFVPDKYLAQYISSRTGVQFVAWNGYCPTHAKILPEHVLRQKEAHSEAKILAHPECMPSVTVLADQVLSTEGMCRYAKKTESKEFIVATEIGIMRRMRKENHEKLFFPASEVAVCPNMKRINLEKILWALEENIYEVKVPVEIREKAKKSIDNMLMYGY